MDNILLCSNHIPLVTSIHNTFIEKYMLRANGSYVKVYLYLSKCIQAGEEDLSISSLADQMENTEKDVIRALNYWEKQGLMRITRSEDGAEIFGIDVLNPDETMETATSIHKTAGHHGTETAASLDAPAAQTSVSGSRKAGSKKHTQDTYTEAAGRTSASSQILTGSTPASPQNPADSASASPQNLADSASTSPQNPADSAPASMLISADTASISTQTPPPAAKATDAPKTIHVTTEQMNRLADNDDFCWTCNVVESYLGHPVKPKEMQLITYLYDTLHFSSELILHLYEYCISLGKTSTNYIQAVALSWDEKQVKTPEDAQNASTEYNAAYTAISKSLALGRSLAMVEKEFVDRWQNKWSMDLSVILEACNRTMLKLQHGDFKYTEGILDRWHRSGVHTLADIQKADEAFAREKAAKKAAEHAGNGSGMVQHGLSKTQAAALEKQLLNA